MSRFRSIDSLSIYFRRLETLVSSLFCDHCTIKCLVESSSFRYLSCPMKLLEEMPWSDCPFHSLVVETFQTFHDQYGGCSMKTLIFFFTRLYSILVDHRDLTKIFHSLDQWIDQSSIIIQREFRQRVTIDRHFFQRLSRDQMIYAECLEQFVAFSSDRLHHVTRVKYLQEKCLFYPSLIFPSDITIEGRHRTVLIDGFLLEDYRHLGYKNSMKIISTSQHSSWVSSILSIIRQYSIEAILCTGTVDNRLKDSVQCFERLSIKFLRLIDEDVIVHYLTDLNDSSQLLSLHYQSVPDDPSLLMIIDQPVGTILHYVPFDHLIDIRHEQFQHCLARCRQILRSKFYLHGSGRFEREFVHYWNEQIQSDLSDEQLMAHEIFTQCLNSFAEELSKKKDLFQSDLIDDVESKIEAWRLSVHLLKILFQIDTVIEIVQNDDDDSDL